MQRTTARQQMHYALQTHPLSSSSSTWRRRPPHLPAGAAGLPELVLHLPPSSPSPRGCTRSATSPRPQGGERPRRARRPPEAADFGTAGASSSRERRPTPTVTRQRRRACARARAGGGGPAGTIVGTPEFLAPGCSGRRLRLLGRLVGLGALLSEMLLGDQVIVSRRRRPPRARRRVSEGDPPEAAAAVGVGGGGEPAARPPHGAQVGADRVRRGGARRAAGAPVLRADGDGARAARLERALPKGDRRSLAAVRGGAVDAGDAHG